VLARLDNVTLAFGRHSLLDATSLTVQEGRRIALIGRNGAGKSSLMRLLAGEIAPDDGSLWLRPGLRMAYLDQSLPPADECTVWDFVASGLGEEAELLSRFQTLSHQTDATSLAELARVQQALDASNGWAMQQRIEQTLERLDLNGEQTMGALSGGWRRRAALARALVAEPDLLLLDEPTNHLDILSIEWLEESLKRFRGSLLFVTHDRSSCVIWPPTFWSWTGALTPCGRATTISMNGTHSPPGSGSPPPGRVRQAPGPGRSLDTPGHQGTKDPQ
jgi:ABC transport system ATP-binding/permease protein